MSRYRLSCAFVPLLLFACLNSAMVFAQTDDPFSIQVESNLVMVRTEVYDKQEKAAWATNNDSYFDSCTRANGAVFIRLPMSQPFIPKTDCLKEIEVENLGTSDFRLFEDGVEQKIEKVVLQPVSSFNERDVYGDAVVAHPAWSYSPRGIWRASDYGSAYNPAGPRYFYRLSYVPSKLEAGTCHKVKVTADQPHTEVFATNQYCYIEHPATDPLLGTAFGRQMEADLTSDAPPKIPLSAQADYFHTDPVHAKLELVLEFPYDKLKHRWIGNDLDAKIGVLGVAYDTNDRIVARFSDAAIVPGDDMSGGSPSADRMLLPSRHETQLDLPPGQYTLRVVLSDSDKFGRAVIPVTVDQYPQNGLALSSLFVYERSRVTAAAAQERAAVNVATDYVPLVSQDVEITPAAGPAFEPQELLSTYFQVYAPMLAQQSNVTVQARVRLVDASGKVKAKYPWFDAMPYRRAGKNVFAITKSLSLTGLPDGQYQVEAQAKDSAGHKTPWRSAELTLKSPKKKRAPSRLF